jgi:plastocyanin
LSNRYTIKTTMTKFALAAVAALIILSCGSEKPPATAATASTDASPTGPPSTPDEINGATLTGTVSFTGPKPTSTLIDMSANPACERAHKNSPLAAEDIVVNPNGTLKYVFVWVKSGLPATERWVIPTLAVTLDQSGCQYKPHMLGVRAGQNIEIKNSDPTNHNIHPQPTVNAEWNDSQAPGGDPKLKTFARQEIMIPVKCNVHPWMRSFIGVVNHPFFAVTGDSGTFTIRGLPPGTYVIQTWHEKFGTVEQTVSVGARESKALEFSFKG